MKNLIIRIIDWIRQLLGLGKQENQIQLLNKKLDRIIHSLSVSENLSVSVPDDPHSLEFLSGDSKSLLTFELKKDFQLDSTWTKIDGVSYDQFSRDSFFHVSQKAAVSGLAVAGTQNLFIATVNPATLMKLTNGGVSSAVLGANGKIISQAGFINAGSAVFTPVVIFQVFSLVTGQYYMNGISKQLNAVQEKLSELISMHHGEREARLRKALHLIQKYSQVEVVGLEDLVIMKNVISDLVEIKEEYFLMLKDSADVIDKALKYETTFSTKKEAEEITRRVKASGFIYKLGMCLKADELYHLATLIEFRINLCAEQTPNRLRIIESKLQDFKTFNNQDFMFNKTRVEYLKVKQNFLRKLKGNLDKSLISGESQEMNFIEMKRMFSDFEAVKKQSFDSIDSSKNLMLEFFQKPIEIAISQNGSNTEIFYKT